MLTVNDLTESERDMYEERSAIYEFDANLSKREAEHKALEEVEKKRELF